MDDELIEEILTVGGIKDVSKQCSGMSLYCKDIELLPGQYAKSISTLSEDDPVWQELWRIWSKVTAPMGYDRSELSHYFRTNTLELTEGRHIEEQDYHKVIISDELAKRNELALGDTIHVLSGVNANEARLKKIQKERQEALMNGEYPDTLEEYMSIVSGFEVGAEVEIPETLECGLTWEVIAISVGLLILVMVTVTAFTARKTLKMRPRDILSSV